MRAGAPPDDHSAAAQQASNTGEAVAMHVSVFTRVKRGFGGPVGVREAWRSQSMMTCCKCNVLLCATSQQLWRVMPPSYAFD
eukprot:1158342-Pelagomonas_calceolata.AAC.5